jgi:hypothetical protein
MIFITERVVVTRGGQQLGFTSQESEQIFIYNYIFEVSDTRKNKKEFNS